MNASEALGRARNVIAAALNDHGPDDIERIHDACKAVTGLLRPHLPVIEAESAPFEEPSGLLNTDD